MSGTDHAETGADVVIGRSASTLALVVVGLALVLLTIVSARCRCLKAAVGFVLGFAASMGVVAWISHRGPAGVGRGGWLGFVLARMAAQPSSPLAA